MPLTEFQQEVFSTLRSSRSPNNFVSRVKLLKSDGDPRDSWSGMRFYPQAVAAMVDAATADSLALAAAGFVVSWTCRQQTVYAVSVTRHDCRVDLEWHADSAVRFFPMEADPETGWRLHFADSAINQLLELSHHCQARDFMAVVSHHENPLSIGSLAWAAAGKGMGTDPRTILDLADRFPARTLHELARCNLVSARDLPKLSEKWSRALNEGRYLVDHLPPDDLGCLYLDPVTRQPVSASLDEGELCNLTRLYATLGGVWPQLLAF